MLSEQKENKNKGYRMPIAHCVVRTVAERRVSSQGAVWDLSTTQCPPTAANGATCVTKSIKMDSNLTLISRLTISTVSKRRNGKMDTARKNQSNLVIPSRLGTSFQISNCPSLKINPSETKPGSKVKCSGTKLQKLPLWGKLRQPESEPNDRQPHV